MKISKGARLLALGAVLVIIDQIIKIVVKTNMTLGEYFYVFGDWFRILFIENEGMAFGMKFGGAAGKVVLSLFRICLFSFLFWWISKLASKGKAVKLSDGSVEYEKVPCGVLIGLTLIAAGALGNIIDCVLYGQIFSESTWTTVSQVGGSYAPVLLGKVVDMFHFPLIDTTWPEWMPIVGGRPFRFFEPVFNFADSCVSVGGVYLVLFQYKFFASDSNK